MSISNKNTKNIFRNKNKIFQISTDVQSNEMLVFQSRSLIEENRLMILSNYTAAFLGNRQLANNNTESIFENRSAILSNTKGRLILEVPHANDPLIRFYKCEEFKKFTFWSQHLILHTCESLKRLCKYSGFKNVSIILKQRYPLSNHLYWINEGRPGGHKTNLSLLDNENLNNEYSNSLIRLGFSDSLIAICET